MARYDHLPIAPLFPLYSGFTVAVMPFAGIWKTAMDLAVLSRQSEQLCCRSRRGYSLRVLERAVRGFPRYHKYALGTDLRRQAQRIYSQRIYSWAPPGAFPSFHPVVR